MPFKLSLKSGICDCWDWRQSHLCCHLMAAHQLPDMQAFPAVMMMPLRTKPAIPSGTADATLCAHLQGMSQACTTFEAGAVGVHEQLQTQKCELRCMNSKLLDLLSRLPAEMRAAKLAQLSAIKDEWQAEAEKAGFQPSMVQAARK